MTTSTANAAIAIIRDLMDKALAAPNGVRVTFSDAKHGSPAASLREAKRWQHRVYIARGQMRRVQASAERDAGGLDGRILGGSAVSPDAYRTAYDVLYAGIDRTEADDGYTLLIRRADLSALDVEIL